MKPNSGLDVARPPIIDEIPHMLPDDLREEKEDVAFLRKWKEKIPHATLAEGRPFKLG